MSVITRMLCAGTWWGLEGVGRIIIVTLLWSEITGGYNTPDTMVEIGAQKWVVK